VSNCLKKLKRKISFWKADKQNKKHKHFNHMNSGTVVGEKLYCAHSNKKLRLNIIEVWDVRGSSFKHVKTVKLSRLPKSGGFLTWADYYKGEWWLCFAFYGLSNSKTVIVNSEFNGEEFIEKEEWVFPAEIIEKWGRWSCS